MNNCKHNYHGMEGAAGFVLYVALLTILTAGTVGGFFLYSAYNHSKAAQRWHDADQCLLDAQSALEQVKYEMIQAYGSNGQSAVTWFLNWSSNAIGATPSYTIPSPLTVNATPVFVTLAGITVFTNAGTKLVTLTLVADARKGYASGPRRKIQEQVRISVGTSTGGSPISANCAFGKYGNNNTLNFGGTLTIDGHNWNLPATFNSGNGSINNPSANDLPGVVYDSTKISTSANISINGNPPQTNAVGAYDATYWYQFLSTITPAATIWAGGNDSLGTRTVPLVKILSSGNTTIASAKNGAGILIIPGGATVKFNQNFYYEGIIIIGSSDANQNVSVTVNNTTTIFGAMICLGSASAVNLSVPGTLGVLYSKQAVANLANITNLPFASSGSNGVPYTSYWREIH
ncbi:MAG: hypothetical protein KJ692_08280 [Verrucomicrobia bacterium]|nr:hypothetical protein [Verrucomicrobiota bacterium]